MIQITAQMRVLVAIEAVDGRKGIDSLARLCQEKLSEDPFSGCVFVFRSRSGTAIRLLSYDGQGYWLAQSVRREPLTMRRGAQNGCAYRRLPSAAGAFSGTKPVIASGGGATMGVGRCFRCRR
jgi:hypothetical protein